MRNISFTKTSMNSLQSIQEFYTGNILNNLSLFLIKNNEKIEEYKQKLSELDSSEHSFSYVINAEWKVEISNSNGELVETIDNISLLNDKLEELNKTTNNKKTAINKQILTVYNENELINEIINKQNFSFTLSSHWKTVEATFDSENPKVKKFLQQKSKTLIVEPELKENTKEDNASNNSMIDIATGVAWATVLWTMLTNTEEVLAEEENTNKEAQDVISEEVLEGLDIENSNNDTTETTEDISVEDNQLDINDDDYHPTSEELDEFFWVDLWENLNLEEVEDNTNEEISPSEEQLSLDFDSLDINEFELNNTESPSNEETSDEYQLTMEDVEEVFWEQLQLNFDEFDVEDTTTVEAKEEIVEESLLTNDLPDSIGDDFNISLDNDFTNFDSIVEEQSEVVEETNASDEMSLVNDEFNFDDFDSLVDNSEELNQNTNIEEVNNTELNSLDSELTLNNSFDDMELPDLSTNTTSEENIVDESNNVELNNEFTDFDNFDLPDLDVETNVEAQDNNEVEDNNLESNSDFSHFDDLDFPDIDTEINNEAQDIGPKDETSQEFTDFDDLDLPDLSPAEDNTTLDSNIENNEVNNTIEDDLDFPEFNDLGTEENNATTVVHNHYTVAPEQVSNGLPIQQVAGGIVAWAAGAVTGIAATPWVIAGGTGWLTAETININNTPLELDPLDTSDLVVDTNSIGVDRNALDVMPDISQINTNSSEISEPNTEWKNNNEEGIWFSTTNAVNVAASATTGAIAMKFISDIKTANKSVENFSPNVFVLKKEGFLDKFSAKEKMLWGALIAFLVFAVVIVWVLLSSMKSAQSELEKKNSELNSKQAEIQNIKKETENAQKEAAKTQAEEEYKNQKITGSSTEGFSLSMIDKIKIEAMEDPNVKADVIANKYLLIRFNSLKPEIGQKLTISFNNWQAPLNYLISKSITGLAEGYNGIVQVIEDEANKTGQNKQFIIITDWNNNFFRANP